MSFGLYNVVLSCLTFYLNLFFLVPAALLHDKMMTVAAIYSLFLLCTSNIDHLSTFSHVFFAVSILLFVYCANRFYGSGRHI